MEIPSVGDIVINSIKTEARMSAMKSVAAVLFMLFITSPSHTAETCTKADLVKAVKHAAGLIESKGKNAFPELDKYRFCDQEGYIFVVAFDGKTLLQPANPSLVGKDITVLQGAKGEFFGAEMKAKAQKDGEGWVSYVWSNPKTKRLEIKCSYVKAATMDGQKVFVGSGIYGVPLSDCN